MISSLSNLTNPASSQASTGKGYADLGQSDFIRLLTVQMQQQDPFDPVDNKEMLAQMAQFSSLSGINDVNTTLKSLSDKFDKLIDAGTIKTGTTTTPAAGSTTVSKGA